MTDLHGTTIQEAQNARPKLEEDREQMKTFMLGLIGEGLEMKQSPAIIDLSFTREQTCLLTDVICGQGSCMKDEPQASTADGQPISSMSF